MQKDEQTYVAVINHEEQYSMWPSDRPVPQGWEAVTEPLSREDCLGEIERRWTDMRPKSMREKMGG